ncbi:MAG: metallophosphoesterase family protein [Bacteriovorax sp.]
MILKTFVFTLLFFISVHSFAFTEDVFKVAPYTLKHTNNHLILNFQTNQDINLIIRDNGENKVYFNYKKNQLYKVELGSVPCGSTEEIEILETQSKEVLYKNTLPPVPCHSLINNAPFVFGFISDTQEFKERHEDIARIIAHHHAIEPLQFLINGGDVVQTGSAEQDWIDYFLGGKLYLMDIPQIAAIGNHDYRGSKGELVPKLFQQFMRWAGSDQYGNLFFDFPSVQLLILNSNFTKLNYDEENHTWTWIEEKMKQAHEIKKPLIIATHFPVYSSSLNVFSSADVIKMRTKLVPLVEKYKVPLVLSGHTHMYERSYKDGINYLVAGPAGGRPNKPSYKNKYVQFFDKDSLTFTKIKLAHRVFTIETYNQENRMIDSLVIDLNSARSSDQLN